MDGCVMLVRAEARPRRSDLWVCLAVWVGLVLVVASAQAGTIRDDVSDSLYTGLANESAYASVGEFQWQESGSEYLASGSLINDQWVLTAAHVVDGITSGNIGTMTFTLGGGTYHVSAVYYHSGWTGSTTTGNDIGLVKLDSVVTDALPTYLYTGTGETHQIATIVGYGQTGTGLTGAVLDAGTKRAGTNVASLGSALNSISWTSGGNDKQIVADFDQPGATGDPTTNLAVPTDLEYCAAPGDSGGGWFIDSGYDALLAGVTSFLDQNPANPREAMYGDICGATRVSSYLSWISSYTTYLVPVVGDANRDMRVDGGDLAIMGGHWSMSVADGRTDADFNWDGIVDGGDLAILGGNWDYGVGSAPLPEPATVVLMAVGLALGLGRRPRRRTDRL
jgi:secreted trypsin-like serine protease